MKASEVAARIRAEKSRTFLWGLARTEALQILGGMPFDFDLSGDMREVDRLTGYKAIRFLKPLSLALICATIKEG